ncbi:MAG TPA: EAL domain-containing protein [Methylovirgula sp.]|nr:EAL domain-containing protein [Methylovirgula sp.]
MVLKASIAKVRSFMAIRTDDPELVKAQCAALSALIPPMYLVLLMNSWILSASFIKTAPHWLTIYTLLALTVICGIRLAIWRRRRDREMTAQAAIETLIRTNRLAVVFAVAFSAWSLALFPYGDAYGRSHIAFFMAVTVVGCIFCLVHLRSAALIVAAIFNAMFIGFFVSTGNPTFVAMAVNVFLITAVMLIVVLIQNRDFNRMVTAQAEALALIAENNRREKEQYRLLRMIDDMPVAVMTVDLATLKINYLNETAKRTLGQIESHLPVKVDELLGASVDVFRRNPDRPHRLLLSAENLPYNARLNFGPEVLDLQVAAVTATDGSYIGPMLTCSIVTKQIEAENRIRQLAHYDMLTGLANRSTFRDQLEASLAKPGHRLGLLFIDLDGFKIINDSKGHLVGDTLLKQVGDRLRQECADPFITVGRLGGDEFAILIEKSDADHACALADRLVDALAAPYHLDHDRRVQVGASIGVVVAPLHGSDTESLLLRADIALYAAKSAGKQTYRMFSPEMESRLQEHVSLEAQLRTALEDKTGLFVFYQPIIDIASGRVTAREALVRWHHPLRGWISPGEFIPVAEESGLIEPLGHFVLNRACREAASWDDESVRVAVNVSPEQLGKGTLAPMILRALFESGLAPGRLEIEVTETALLNDELDCIADLRRVHDMGVRVALDDFGTGFSSLAHLRTFPFDKIKIDGSFVRDAVKRPDCAAVVKAVADLGKRLGVTTVAEGVETQAHLDCVTAEGCIEVQGYLMGRPAPSARDARHVAELDRAASEISMSA